MNRNLPLRASLLLLAAFSFSAGSAAMAAPSGTWTELFPVNSPPLTAGHTVVADGVAAYSFGGKEGGAALQNHLWKFDGVDWTDITPATTLPPTRKVHSLVWDSGRNRLVLFGGTGGGSSATLRGHWEFDGMDWIDLGTSGTPIDRCATAMTYVSGMGKSILFGGYRTSQMNDTWEYVGAGTPPVFYCGYTDPSTATSCGFMSCPSSSGCQATIATSIAGDGPVSGANDYDVSFSGAEVGKPAIIFFGLSGTMAVPFSSGTLCVQTPIKRTPPGSTGGSGACTGSHSLRINDPASSISQTAGTMVHYQGWLRDPAGVGTDLSDAVELLFQ